MNKEILPVIFDKASTIVLLFLKWFDKARAVDFLAPLLMRFYLAPVFWMAGTKKFINFTSTAEWFGNSDWGLGLPVPYLLVILVGLFEIIGAICLFFGVGVRLISVPLMIIMVVAAVMVHLQNGWLAIAEGSGIFANERTAGAIERLNMAKSILKDYGNYEWLMENGNFVVLNNGIEFAATYFIMLLTLFFIGGGRFVSADYWLRKKYISE